MSLQGKLDAFKANFESGGPPYNAPDWVHEQMQRATSELISSGAASGALEAGDKAPEFELVDADGKLASSANLLESGPLVVTFYRGFWCPYCNLDLQAIQGALPDLQNRGASVVAISPQTAVNSRRAINENGLKFTILTDPGNVVAASFGLRVELPDYLVSLYRDTFQNDLAVTNGEPSWTLPMPARFVIDRGGTIAYAEVNADYTRRPDPSELLPTLDRLQRLTTA